MRGVVALLLLIGGCGPPQVNCEPNLLDVVVTGNESHLGDDVWLYRDGKAIGFELTDEHQRCWFRNIKRGDVIKTGDSRRGYAAKCLNDIRQGLNVVALEIHRSVP